MAHFPTEAELSAQISQVEQLDGVCRIHTSLLRLLADGYYRHEEESGKLAQWRVWAHLRLERGGEPLGDDMEMRRAIGDLLDAAKTKAPGDA